MGKKRERESEGGVGVVPGGDSASSMFTEVRAQVSLKLMPVPSKHTAPSRTTGTLDHGPSVGPCIGAFSFCPRCLHLHAMRTAKDCELDPASGRLGCTGGEIGGGRSLK